VIRSSRDSYTAKVKAAAMASFCCVSCYCLTLNFKLWQTTTETRIKTVAWAASKAARAARVVRLVSKVVATRAAIWEAARAPVNQVEKIRVVVRTVIKIRIPGAEAREALSKEIVND
jgi:hypothetical protein